MILKLLNDVKKKSNGEEKTIIFSQFTSMLDLIQPFLRESEIPFVRCMLPPISPMFASHLLNIAIVDDGSMSKEDREASLKKIKDVPKYKVILVSFRAGSTGSSKSIHHHSSIGI